VPAKDLFYYRLQVANTGRSAARNVEVFARAVYRQTSTGAWADVARVLPEWLSWATVRHFGDFTPMFLPVLPAKADRYLDLCHVFRPSDRPSLDELEQDPDTPAEQTVVSLDLVIKYRLRGHLMGPGTYAIVLEVGVSEVEPRVFTF